MSVTTIQIPAEQVGAIRESLASRRRELEGVSAEGGPARLNPPEQLEEVAQLLEQLGAVHSSDSAPREITGSRALIWTAAYDALCGAAESIAEDCNDYWRRVLEPADIRVRIAMLAARLDLLESLGAPPGE